jgi:uncharacterized LabA/DUF88 family protein
LTIATIEQPLQSQVRVRAFVDYWNFVLSCKEWNPEFNLDWKAFGPWLCRNAGALALPAPEQRPLIRYEGLHVYGSYNPKADSKFRSWMMNTVDRFPGVQVVMKERKPKHPPKCPGCHQLVESCPHCTGTMVGSVEKGIDTAIVTDMIKLAWEDAYDIAVLVSADRDFIPAVELLDAKGVKVVHAGFAPKGMDLARKCWASFDLKGSIGEISRPNHSTPPR